MINATEARKISDTLNERVKQSSYDWAVGELEYIENHIKEAAANGKYDTKYWWGDGCIKEAKIDKKIAFEAFKELLHPLGYGLSCAMNTVARGDFTLYISWWMEEEEENV